MNKPGYYAADDVLAVRSELQQWFETDLGQELITLEQQKVSRILPELFGYHILQLGCLENYRLLASSRISHKIISSLVLDNKTESVSSLVCSNHALPIASDTMDVVIMPHILEFESNPHQLLRESERILIGEGHIVIIGFNPVSFWGLTRLFFIWSDSPPWCGHYVGLTRLKDWLKLLGFEITAIERFYFRPPIQNSNIMQRLLFIEKVGRICWPFWGGIYLLVAKKRVTPVTPVKMQWQKRRRMIASGAAEPSTRVIKN